MGVSDSEVQANLHRIESSAEAVGLMINVWKTKNMGVKCKKPGASVPIAQKNVEVLTGNHKGRYGTLIETENQSLLLIGREVLVGKKRNAGWFETLADEKLRLKSSVEAELLTVSSDERSVVADLVSTARNRSSAVSNDESCVIQVVNVASTLQEAAKCMKPDSASLRIRRVSKTARQSLLG